MAAVVIAFLAGLVLAMSAPATPPPAAVGVTVYGYRVMVTVPRRVRADCSRLSLSSHGVPVYVAGARRTATGCSLVLTTTARAFLPSGLIARAGAATYAVRDFAPAFNYTPAGTAVMPR